MPHALRIASEPDGAILYDATQLGPSADPRWFAPESWLTKGQASAARRGRGDVLFIDAPFGRAVLRHYRRGGLVGRLVSDRYWWSGAENTRSFRELRMLERLRDQQLPVPGPLAARFQRFGLTYRADILIALIADSRTLAEMVAQQQALDWSRVGECIAEFHRHGVWHADLNAHNILVDQHGKVWLIDFDRARLRPAAAQWQQANLSRLLRSLRKIGAPSLVKRFGQGWADLVAAHARTLHASAAPA